MSRTRSSLGERDAEFTKVVLRGSHGLNLILCLVIPADTDNKKGGHLEAKRQLTIQQVSSEMSPITQSLHQASHPSMPPPPVLQNQDD